ncbi:hypothetical protein Elgi_06800 [Paenibacillus elgii]|uniref:hypothetical protein n=1 Tax=Paenibacillus elgii TaxID=189691 RepID=UPI002D7DAA83|nr:hypothetical protein Elgi_06800 [Paenibacillus elgii]
MSILLRIERESGGQSIELSNGQITGYSYINTSPADFFAKAYNAEHSIQIRGEIPLRLLPPVEQDADNSNTLYAWALTEYRPDNDYYRSVIIQIVRHEKTIREVKFPHAYVHVYQEQVNGLKGVLEFELVVRQRRDQLDSIQFGFTEKKELSFTKEKGKPVTILSRAPKPSDFAIRRDLNQIAWYENIIADGSVGDQQWAQSMLDSGAYFIDINYYVPGVYLTFKDLEARGINMGLVRDINAPGINTLLNPEQSSGAKAAAKKTYVTAKQLEELGWHNVNDDMVNGLNNTLEKYDITSTERIRHFIAQCMQESGLGEYTRELAPKNSDPEEHFNKKYDGRTELGNKNKGDGAKFRGSGYIQITGRDVYQKFADFMDDPKIVDEGYSYVEKKYPWEAAGYFWGKYKNLNPLVDKGASVLEISKKVNGFNKTTGLPNHHEEREKYFKLCKEVIK